MPPSGDECQPNMLTIPKGAIVLWCSVENGETATGSLNREVPSLFMSKQSGSGGGGKEERHFFVTYNPEDVWLKKKKKRYSVPHPKVQHFSDDSVKKRTILVYNIANMK